MSLMESFIEERVAELKETGETEFVSFDDLLTDQMYFYYIQDNFNTELTIERLIKPAGEMLDDCKIVWRLSK